MEENKSSENGKEERELSSYSCLPYDIIFDTLTRLPVKSLVRFRSVSKQWLFTISYDPQFLQKHLFRANQNPKLTHYVKSHGSHSIYITLDEFIIRFPSSIGSKGSFNNTNYANILSNSCNGLVLVGTGEKDRFLCNPSTRSYKKNPGNFYHFRDFIKMYGLGYDPSVEAYKVIMIVRSVTHSFFSRMLYPNQHRSTHDSTIVRVYNSRTNSWTRIQEFPYEVFFDQQGLLVNGTPHWVVARAKTRECIIIYFDLVADKFKELETPSWLVLDCNCYLEVSSQGFLSLCRKSEVWVMKEYGTKESLTN